MDVLNNKPYWGKPYSGLLRMTSIATETFKVFIAAGVFLSAIEGAAIVPHDRIQGREDKPECLEKL